MAVKYNAIFPSRKGNLVIGNYPHRMTPFDAAALVGSDFRVIELQGWNVATIARKATAEECLPFMNPMRWLVFPEGYQGDSTFLYGDRIPSYTGDVVPR